MKKISLKNILKKTFNKKYSEIWPNINEKKDPPKDHEEFKNEQNKFEKYFKENL